MTLADLPDSVDGFPVLEWIEGQFEVGARMSDIASLLGISRAQLNELKRSEPEVNRAINRGLAGFHGFLTDRLREIVTCGNERNAMTSIMFLLKSRFSYVDNPKADEKDPVINLRLELPQAFATTREYERARLVAPELAARTLPDADDEEPT